MDVLCSLFFKGCFGSIHFNITLLEGQQRDEVSGRFELCSAINLCRLSGPSLASLMHKKWQYLKVTLLLGRMEAEALSTCLHQHQTYSWRRFGSGSSIPFLSTWYPPHWSLVVEGQGHCDLMSISVLWMWCIRHALQRAQFAQMSTWTRVWTDISYWLKLWSDEILYFKTVEVQLHFDHHDVCKNTFLANIQHHNSGAEREIVTLFFCNLTGWR